MRGGAAAKHLGASRPVAPSGSLSSLPSWSGAAVRGPAESGPPLGKGPRRLSLILLTGLKMRLHLPPRPAITHGWHLSPSKGVTRGAARSLACVPKAGRLGSRPGCEEALQEWPAAALSAVTTFL